MLDGKIAIVTGAARGIGREVAEAFVAHGAVVYAMDLRADDLSWASNYDGVKAVALDVCDFSEVKDAVMRIKKDEGKIDVLVNNAGLISYELMQMIDYEKLRKMFEVNVIALIHLTQLVSRVMARNQVGSIINMASMVGEKGAKGQLGYSATKGAVIAVTKSAAKELAGARIRVNAIAPGMVGTDRFKAVLAEKFADKISDVPFGRLAEPSDVANLCLYLASDTSSYVTGQVIGVDGGLVL